MWVFHDGQLRCMYRLQTNWDFIPFFNLHDLERVKITVQSVGEHQIQFYPHSDFETLGLVDS